MTSPRWPGSTLCRAVGMPTEGELQRWLSRPALADRDREAARRLHVEEPGGWGAGGKSRNEIA
ncbi:hypothetical protein [Streptomyces noursei]|uniref:hypothetical protein n=1 Tax=Streptomyces noursei TaxID=1971 RepID=UPI00135207F0